MNKLQRYILFLVPASVLVVQGVFFTDAVSSLKGGKPVSGQLIDLAAVALAVAATLGAIVTIGEASKARGWMRWILGACWATVFLGSGAVITLHVAAGAIGLTPVAILSAPELPAGFLRVVAYSAAIFIVPEVSATGIYLAWLSSSPAVLAEPAEEPVEDWRDIKAEPEAAPPPAPAPIPDPEPELLTALSKIPGGATTHELARYVGSVPTIVGAQIERLLADGHVSKRGEKWERSR